MTDLTNNVVHEVEKHQFTMALPNDEQAYIRYKLNQADAKVDFVSTFVPTSQRGGGIAAKLVREAFAWADASNLTISASCWYADRILKKRNASGQS